MKSVHVLGAGMVGIGCAIALNRSGWNVTLVDRGSPGSGTSFGNAGILSRGSVMPLNNTALLRQLPKLLTDNVRGKHGALRFDFWHAARNLSWISRFLGHAADGSEWRRARALDSLLAISLDAHRTLMTDSGCADRLREDGWLKVHRSDASLKAAGPELAMFEAFGIDYRKLGPADIKALEPHLAPRFAGGISITANASVDQPGEVCRAYAELFAREGGTVLESEVQAIEQAGDALRLRLGSGTRVEADRVVVALGPWSDDLLSPLGYQVPLGVERGYHRHYGATGNATLTRPVHDASGGYVLVPMRNGYRLTTGVELAPRDAPPSPWQVTVAERRAREVFPLGDAIDAEPWLGRRPTLPDALPMIGRAPRHRNLWLAFGHQHIGLTMGPATGLMLAAMMNGENPAIDMSPFRAERYL